MATTHGTGVKMGSAVADHDFQKALRMLDHGQRQRGEELLLSAIDAAEREADPVTLIGASCALGDLYYQNELYEDARLLLEQAIRLVDAREDDVCSDEKRRAVELLMEMK